MRIGYTPLIDTTLSSLCRSPGCIHPAIKYDLYCRQCSINSEKEKAARTTLIAEKLPKGIVWCYFIKLSTGKVRILHTSDMEKTKSRFKSKYGNVSILCQFPARDFIPALIREILGEHRINGVLFNYGKEVLEFAKNAKKGRFPEGLGGVYPDIQSVFHVKQRHINCKNN